MMREGTRDLVFFFFNKTSFFIKCKHTEHSHKDNKKSEREKDELMTKIILEKC